MTVTGSSPNTLEPVAFDDEDAEAERFFAEGHIFLPDHERLDRLASELDAPDAWDEPERAPLSEQQLARRALLRRWVARGMGGGVLLLLAGIAFARRGTASVGTAAPSPPAATAARTASERPRTPPARLSEPQHPVATLPSAEPLAAPAPSASADEPDEPDEARIASAEQARLLTTKARRLLEGGRINQGVAAAREAIAADPSRSEAYILLAAGLEDLGLWQQAKRVFASCVTRSREGRSAECAYFAKSGR